jgi:hypothetical protein
MHGNTAGRAQPGARHTTARARACAVVWQLSLALLAGCVAPSGRPVAQDQVLELQQHIEVLQAELAVVRQGLADRGDQQAVVTETLEARLSSLQAQVESLPDELADLCPPPPVQTSASGAAPTDEAPRVPAQAEKLVVGEMERVWLDPPGAVVVARIDAGIETSTLIGQDIVVFERDGRRWVRFGLVAEGGEEGEPVSVERPLRRHVRVNPPYDGSGTRRPSVTLRLHLGQVRESIEVALVELPDQEYGMVLGRNFLTDLAVFDVSQKFVQPAFRAP